MRLCRAAIPFVAFLAAFLVPVPLVTGTDTNFDPGGKWPAGRIRIAVSRSLETAINIRGDVPEALARSVSLWTGVADARIEITQSDVQSVSRKGTRGDGVSLITSALTPENSRLFPHESNSPAAITRVFTDARGRIVEADIVLNPFVTFSTDGAFDTYDLQDTLTHEIGHLLGLDHSLFLGSIMHERTLRSPGPADFTGSRRVLPMIDIASIRALYGTNAEEFTCCGTVSGSITGLVRGSTGQIWIEEANTGRLVAGGSPRVDGTFQIDGIPEGVYTIRVFVKNREGKVASADANFSISPLDSKRMNLRLSSMATGVLPELFGTSMKLGRTAVRLSSSYRYLLLGGDDSLKRVSRVGVAGSEVWIVAGEPIPFDSTQSVKMLQLDISSFGISAPGEYSLVIEDITGVKTYFPAALSILN